MELASTHILREGKQSDTRRDGSVIQRGDGKLQDLSYGWRLLTFCEKASKEMWKGACQHSSGAMERYRTWAGVGVYSLQSAGTCNRAHRGKVSTPAGRWNVTGLDGRGWRLLTICERASAETNEGVGQHSSGAMERYGTWWADAALTALALLP